MDKSQKIIINNFSYGFLYNFTGVLIYIESFGFNKSFSGILELFFYCLFWLPMLISEIVVRNGFLQ